MLMKPIRVLMIDDEKTLCDLVKMNLELYGKFEVHIANDGREGAKAAIKLLPDVILLDIIMPKQDGFQTLAALKKNPKTISIPVIMLSAMTDNNSVTKASSMYSEYYITKPISSEKLIEKIGWVLNINKDNL